MLKLTGGGNAINSLTTILKKRTWGIAIYKVSQANTLIIPISHFWWWDSFNKISSYDSKYVHFQQKYYIQFITNSFIILWTRVNFRGKGYRVRVFKKNLKLTLNFGYSHWTKIKFYKYWLLYKLRRQNYLLFTNFRHDMLNFLLLLPHIRTYNKYTQRGLRLKRQCIKQRFGKISQYVSSLH